MTSEFCPKVAYDDDGDDCGDEDRELNSRFAESRQKKCFGRFDDVVHISFVVVVSFTVGV